MVSSADPPGRTWTREAAKAFRIAAASVRSLPIASPVDFISGPRYESTDGSWFIENTGALTATRSRAGPRPVLQPRADNFSPSITRVAISTIAPPVTFERNGTDLE